jgi:hypothetical protein
VLLSPAPVLSFESWLNPGRHFTGKDIDAFPRARSETAER